LGTIRYENGCNNISGPDSYAIEPVQSARDNVSTDLNKGAGFDCLRSAEEFKTRT